jgi:hypothetical protein
MQRKKNETKNIKIAAIDRETGIDLDSLTIIVNSKVVAEDVDSYTLTEKKGELLIVEVIRSGYVSITASIRFNDDDDVTLELTRKRITIMITPEIVGYADYLSRRIGLAPSEYVEHTAYILQIGDSTWADIGSEVNTNNLPIDVTAGYTEITLVEGTESTVSYPTGAEALEVRLWAQYFPKEGHEYSVNNSNFLNVAAGSAELSGDSDSDITLDLDHIPACSDGVDNDFYDGVDRNDPGCIDLSGNYDPEDDVELTNVSTSTYGIFSEDTNYFVSGKQGEQVSYVIGSHHAGFPSSIQIAHSITVEFTAKVEEDQTGEEFALRWYIGPNRNSLNDVYTTDIIQDDGLDGWKTIQVHQLTKEWFKNGTNHKIDAIHATKIHGEPATNGDDDVIIYEAQRSDYFGIQWIYQPERVPKSAGKVAKSANPNVDVTISDVGPDTDIRRN